jgi:hypothetical protein
MVERPRSIHFHIIFSCVFKGTMSKIDAEIWGCGNCIKIQHILGMKTGSNFFIFHTHFLSRIFSLNLMVSFVENTVKNSLIVRQAERADFSKLMICQIFSTDVQNCIVQLYNFVTIHEKLVQIWTVSKPYKGKTIESLEIGRENVIFFGRKLDISHRIHNKLFTTQKFSLFFTIFKCRYNIVKVF